MEWKEFTEKYKGMSDEFNAQEFDERVRTSRLMTYEAVRELIRSKRFLQKALLEIDGRIKELTPELDKYLKTSNQK
jgi:hypothetical protein